MSLLEPDQSVAIAVHPWRWLRRKFWAGWYGYRVPTGWGLHFGFGYIDVSHRDALDQSQQRPADA